MEILDSVSPIHWSPGVTLEAIEKQVILKAFRHYRGNKTATANALGIAVRTLDNKLEKYEADGKAEKERQDNARIQHEQYLARARGGGKQPNNVFTGDAPRAAETQGPQRNNGPAAGVRVESPAQSASQQTVPVSEREKVQGVLPQQAAQSGPGKRR